LTSVSRHGLGAVFIVLVLLGGACGRTEGDRPGDVHRSFATRHDPTLARLGFHLTRAGFTSESSSDAYVEGGSHLAVYVEPLHPLTDQQYLDALPDVVQEFLPSAFDERPGLQSFDVCLEPISRDREPPPRIQLLVNRGQAQLVDWKTATTATLVAGTKATPNIGTLFVDDALRASPAWQAIDARAP
jgi:hypothetical protein